jgi:hypothetical protein
MWSLAFAGSDSSWPEGPTRPFTNLSQPDSQINLSQPDSQINLSQRDSQIIRKRREGGSSGAFQRIYGEPSRPSRLEPECLAG